MAADKRETAKQTPGHLNMKENTMKHSIRIIFSVLASAGTFTSTLPTATVASPMPIVQQKPDLDKYCQRYYGAKARLIDFSATGWQCYKSQSQTWGISVKRACQDQFDLPKAAYLDKADPYSWFCTIENAKPARIDLNRYCIKHFGGSAHARLIGTRATDWVCQHGSWGRDGISGNRACQEQHGLPKASYTDRNDPYSWYCHR